MSARPAERDPVQTLQRWEDAGGTWQVASRTDASLTLALCRCDGPEADRITSSDPELLRFVGERSSSED